MRHRRPLSITAVVVAVVTLAAGCSDEEPPDWLVERAAPTTTTVVTTTTLAPTTTVPAGGGAGEEVLAIDLEPGSCIEDAAAFTGQEVRVITRATVVPCGRPHQAEVYARAQLEGGDRARFPGINRLRRQAQQLCRDRFRPFVGIPWTRSELEIAALWPSPRSWEQGDRLVVCAVFRLDGAPLTGTARNARI
jgi:hypothetical protein